jgi:uncharacterized membrane protein
MSRNVLSGGLLGVGFAAFVDETVFHQLAFQLYDGTVQHKLMRLHQIRYGVSLAPYDWTWNIIAGALLLLRGRRRVAGRAGRDMPGLGSGVELSGSEAVPPPNGSTLPRS